MNPKIVVIKYSQSKIWEKSFFGRALGVINNTGIQIYNKKNAYKWFLSNDAKKKKTIWEEKLRNKQVDSKK